MSSLPSPPQRRGASAGKLGIWDIASNQRHSMQIFLPWALNSLNLHRCKLAKSTVTLASQVNTGVTPAHLHEHACR